MCKDCAELAETLREIMKISLDTQQKARHVIEEQRLIIDKLQRIAFPKTYGEYTAGEAWSDLTNAIKT